MKYKKLSLSWILSLKSKGKGQQLKWFTLVELLVVIAIITIISVSSFSSFWWFLNTLSLNNSLENFKFTLKNLDSKIKNNDLFDYKMILKKDKSWFYFYENYYFWDKKQELSTIDFNSWTWKIHIPSWTSTWILLYNIYLDWKLLKKDIIRANETKEFNFLKNDEVFVKSSLNWERTNDIKIYYFSSRKTEKKSNVILKNILCDSGEKTELIIKNIWWKKEFKENTTTNCINPKLIFESEEAEVELELK